MSGDICIKHWYELIKAVVAEMDKIRKDRDRQTTDDEEIDQ